MPVPDVPLDFPLVFCEARFAMPDTRHTSRLDPRAPFVLDTRELGRRPGSMQRVRRTVPAPGGWGLDIVRVAAGSDLGLDLRLESVVDGVLVSGTVSAAVGGECGRCLEPLEQGIEVDLQELFAYEPDPGDEDAPLVQGELIDIEPLVRDAVVLALPLTPLCDEDCAGLCPVCGVRLAEAGDDHAHDDQVDPRWAALASLNPNPEEN